MREVEKSAASVEEAVEAALEELGISEQEAEVQIVKESRGGLLGLGSKGATVRVRARGETAPAEQADFALEFVTGLIDRMVSGLTSSSTRSMAPPTWTSWAPVGKT